MRAAGGCLNALIERPLPVRRAGSRVRPRCHPPRLNYLNNRYMDPVLGVFVSVDPLVGKTGTPYLYAAENPTTLSDPEGLCAGREGSRGGCGVDYYRAGGKASFKGGRFDDYGLYCGQGRNGVYGGQCNSYGFASDGGNWNDGNYWVSSAACGGACRNSIKPYSRPAQRHGLLRMQGRRVYGQRHLRSWCSAAMRADSRSRFAGQGLVLSGLSLADQIWPAVSAVHTSPLRAQGSGLRRRC